MREIYHYKNLMLGNIIPQKYQCYIFGSSDSLMGPYLFNKNDSNKYEEVFSEIEYDEINTFLKSLPANQTYIRPLEDQTIRLERCLEKSELENLKQFGDLLLPKRRIIDIYTTIRNQIAIEREIQRQEEEKIEKRYMMNHLKK